MPQSDSASSSAASKDSKESVENVENAMKADEPSFGWNSYAELVNGRIAMLAFLSLLALEWFTRQDLFTWLGLWK